MDGKAPSVDAVRPSCCPRCSTPGCTAAGRCGLYGHGTRVSQLLGPAVVGGAPVLREVKAVRSGVAPHKEAAVSVRQERRIESTRKGSGKPSTFDFLGFTHICGKSKSGASCSSDTAPRNACARSFNPSAVSSDGACINHQGQQGEWLRSVVRGYLAYHAVPANAHAIRSFCSQVVRSWHKALRRWSQHDSTSWARTNRLAKRWIPPARVAHPSPETRFDVRTRGRSRVR